MTIFEDARGKELFDSLVDDLRREIPHMYEVEDEIGNVRSIYLGSFMTLDPCGKYHHTFSPNGITTECEEFWATLHDAADELGGWINSGEGDPTDIYFQLPIEE